MHLVVGLGVKQFLAKISTLHDKGAIAHVHHFVDEAHELVQEICVNADFRYAPMLAIVYRLINVTTVENN